MQIVTVTGNGTALALQVRRNLWTGSHVPVTTLTVIRLQLGNAGDMLCLSGV